LTNFFFVTSIEEKKEVLHHHLANLSAKYLTPFCGCFQKVSNGGF